MYSVALYITTLHNNEARTVNFNTRIYRHMHSTCIYSLMHVLEMKTPEYGAEADTLQQYKEKPKFSTPQNLQYDCAYPFVDSTGITCRHGNNANRSRRLTTQTSANDGERSLGSRGRR